MNARFTGMVSSVSCLFLASAVIGGEPVAKPVKKTIRTDDGLNLVCEVRGQGDTALVFLHGWCGDREYWKHQVDAFAADYRVITLDQAGHGESGKDRKAWSVSGLAGDIEAVIKALGLRRVILVGHSMGGPVALLAAKRMPGSWYVRARKVPVHAWGGAPSSSRSTPSLAWPDPPELRDRAGSGPVGTWTGPQANEHRPGRTVQHGGRASPRTFLENPRPESACFVPLP